MTGARDKNPPHAIQERLEVVHTVIELVKNLTVVLVLVYVAIAGLPALSTVFAEITNRQVGVSEFKAGKDGVDVKLQNLEVAKQGLTAVVNAQTGTEGSGDQPVAPQNQQLLAALEDVDQKLKTMDPGAAAQGVAAGPRWVYLGTQKSGGWSPNNFQLHGPPAPGMNITAATDVYQRDNKPTRDDVAGIWRLGKAVGILRQGQAAKVLAVAHEEPDAERSNWWAQIR